jgi:hypothetical protein
MARRNYMNKLICASILACLFLTASGCAQQADKPAVISLMIDADVPPSPSEHQGYESEVLLKAMIQEIDGRELGATIFSTEDTLGTYTRTLLTQMGKNPRFELAMSGNNSKEKLSAEVYNKQKTILEDTKRYTEACKYCGINEINVTGFMPPSFDQNEDTYRILDELGIQYDAGYQAGMIYTPGHEKDTWPYQVQDHKFFAVPVSNYSLSGKLIPLQDRYFNESGMSSIQWHDALVSKFEETQKNDQPMVIVLTSSVSGTGGYLDALKKFLDFALSNKASFVTTMDLVKMAHPESFQPSAAAAKECTTCGQHNDNISVTIAMENLTQNATKAATD